jgi:hypothetical protein
VNFDARLHTALSTIHARPTATEASAIVDVARLAAAADKRSDVGETSVLIGLSHMICEMAGIQDLDLTHKIDSNRLLDIGEHLVPNGARELAFACAYIVVFQDLELTVEEKQLIDALPAALVIDPDRATQLASEMENLIRTSRG